MIERESVDVWVGEGADNANENGLPCHSEDPELFFAESPTDVELAKQVCGPCPLRAACLGLRRLRPPGWRPARSWPSC